MSNARASKAIADIWSQYYKLEVLSKEWWRKRDRKRMFSFLLFIVVVFILLLSLFFFFPSDRAKSNLISPLGLCVGFFRLCAGYLLKHKTQFAVDWRGLDWNPPEGT